MPHLHLPADHSDADIVLAANVAATVGSEDLYVAWTYETGAGAIPEIDAVMREHHPGTLSGILRAVREGVRALWFGLTHSPTPAMAGRAAASASRPREISS
jgi:hypothetical protein